MKIGPNDILREHFDHFFCHLYAPRSQKKYPKYLETYQCVWVATQRFWEKNAGKCGKMRKMRKMRTANPPLAEQLWGNFRRKLATQEGRPITEVQNGNQSWQLQGNYYANDLKDPKKYFILNAFRKLFIKIFLFGYFRSFSTSIFFWGGILGSTGA